MSWRALQVSTDLTHHVAADGAPAYPARFDEVLKFHAPGLAPVLQGGAAWHIHPDGRAAYAERHLRTFGFYEGRAAVHSDSGWHHITPTGQPLYAQRYGWCGNFQGGRCAVREAGGAYLHIDLAGVATSQARWRYAGDYRDGLAVVQASDGRSTHVDESGQLTHSCWFHDLDVFHKGYARARDEGGWCHVDLQGRPVYDRRLAAVEPFYNGQARVERFDGALEVIDERGRTLRQLRPPQRSELAQLSSDMVGFWRTQTIGAAVELGLPELLPGTTAAVAEGGQLTLDGALRLLKALEELGLVHSAGERWELTGRGGYLCRDHPMTLADAAMEYSGPLAQMWLELPRALSSSASWSAPDVFGEVARDDARREGHHRMLRSYARHDYPLIAAALELGPEAHVVDAGGGVGVLAQLLLERTPSLTVTVLERPEVVAQGRRERAGELIRWREASLFDEWGLQADVVVLARVLHDWPDEDALQILKRAREALAPGGQLFIVELLLQERGSAGSLCDLHLLMATGGRERTGAHYERLLTEAGFRPAGIRSVAALPSIVLGVAQ